MILSRKNITGLLAFSLLLSACAPKQNATKVTVHAAGQIIGGTPVKAGDDIQKSTAIVFSWNQTAPPPNVVICSSSLITKNLLVTAAHCLVDDNSVRLTDGWQTYVSFNTSLNLKDGSILAGAIAIPRAQIIVNPNYKRADTADADDIALIKLPSDAPASQIPVPILKDASVLTAPNTTITAAGYGVSTLDGKVEDTTGIFALRSMKSFIDLGYTEMPDVVPIANWGAALAIGEGDSGGPAFVNVGGTTYLFGACSSSNDHEAFYTNLLMQMNWLKASATTLQADTNF